MEVTGLAVGVAGLASLFSACIEAVERIESYRKFGFELRNLNAQFNADKVLFYQWARSVGISASGVRAIHHPLLDGEEIASTTAAILSSIHEIFSMTESSLFETPDSTTLDGNIGPLADPFKPVKDLPTRSKPSRPFGLRGQKLGWALGGKTKFHDRIKAFGELVGKLYSLVPLQRDASDAREGVPDHHALFLENRSDLQEILSRVRENTRKEVKQWLRATTTNDIFEEKFSSCLPSTCKWILENDSYKSWVCPMSSTQPSKVLWLYGLPGTGKSVLCASLAEQFKANSGSFLGEFFCSSDTDSLIKIIQSWIWQAAITDSKAFDTVSERMHGSDNEFISAADTWELFEAVFLNLTNATLVADGLDECIRSKQEWHSSRISEFFVKLKQYISRISVRVLLVSRHDSAIQAGIGTPLITEPEPEISTYQITKDDLQSDVSLYSQSIIENKLRRHNQELKNQFAQRMAEKCEGMFLWIKLQGDSLRGSQSKRQLQETIEDMPHGLERTYDRYWNVICQLPERDKHKALSILRWTVFSLRPLAVFELAECLAVQDDDTCDDLQTDDLPEFIDDEYVNYEILGLCGSLLEIYSTDPELVAEQKLVRVPHYSIKQYIISKFSEISPLSNADFEHNLLAKLCIRYLAYEYVWNREFSSATDIQTHSFLDYALNSWPSHIRANGSNYQEVICLVNKFFEPGNYKWVCWRGRYASANDHEWIKSYGSTAKLGGQAYYAAFFNLLETLEYLQNKMTTPWNEIGGRYGTALQAACANGHRSVVSFLVRSGADLNTKSGEFGCALNAAVTTGDETLTEMLLDAGASSLNSDPDGQTPILLASREGHPKIVHQLITHGADKAKASGDDWTPLQIAAAYGHTEVIKLLVDAAIELDVADNRGLTALHYAADNGHTKAVTLLVESGASIATINDHEWTPLWVAASRGHREVVELLLDKGADIACSNYGGLTPLSAAARSGHVEVVKLLLERGANLSIANSKGWTPLNAAANNGHVEVAKLLLERGADLNVANAEGWTPLNAAALGGHVEVVKLLLKGEANPNIVNIEGWPPMHLATSYGHIDVVNLLLEWGANIDAVNDYGSTPLQEAADSGHIDVVKLLLERGADMGATNHGYTALHRAVFRGHLEVVSLLASKSTPAMVNSADDHSISPLHLAAQGSSPAIVAALIFHGADPLKLDHFGRTSLDWASHFSPCFEAMGSWSESYSPTPKEVSIEILKRSLSRIIREIRTTHVWSYYELERCLVQLGDLDSAAAICEAGIAGKEILNIEHPAICDRCHSRIESGPRFVCTSCATCDLCHGCFQALRSEIAVSRCTNHEFLRVPRPGWSRANGDEESTRARVLKLLDTVEARHLHTQTRHLELSDSAMDSVRESPAS